jgi:Icc-related predicted phosphoesterase
VDVLITHAPPAGVGDGADRPHHGFATYHRLVRGMRPPLLLHGHVHPHGQPRRDHDMRGTSVRNVVGHRIMEITPGAARVPDGAGR